MTRSHLQGEELKPVRAQTRQSSSLLAGHGPTPSSRRPRQTVFPSGSEAASTSKESLSIERLSFTPDRGSSSGRVRPRFQAERGKADVDQLASQTPRLLSTCPPEIRPKEQVSGRPCPGPEMSGSQLVAGGVVRPAGLGDTGCRDPGGLTGSGGLGTGTGRQEGRRRGSRRIRKNPPASPIGATDSARDNRSPRRPLEVPMIPKGYGSRGMPREEGGQASSQASAETPQTKGCHVATRRGPGGQNLPFQQTAMWHESGHEDGWKLGTRHAVGVAGKDDPGAQQRRSAIPGPGYGPPRTSPRRSRRLHRSDRSRLRLRAGSPVSAPSPASGAQITKTFRSHGTEATPEVPVTVSATAFHEAPSEPGAFSVKATSGLSPGDSGST